MNVRLPVVNTGGARSGPLGEGVVASAGGARVRCACGVVIAREGASAARSVREHDVSRLAHFFLRVAR